MAENDFLNLPFFLYLFDFVSWTGVEVRLWFNAGESVVRLVVQSSMDIDSLLDMELISLWKNECK